jgi:hypothetical protein
MPIAHEPIRPSPATPMFCAECGCEVDPVAWQCATCGSALHEPDAMTSTSPYKSATTKNSQPAFMVGSEIFSILMIVGFVILHIGLRSQLIPEAYSRQLIVVYWLILLGFIWVILTEE